MADFSHASGTGTKPVLRVAIVEDKPRTLRLLREYIQGDRVEVVAAFQSGEEALSGIESDRLPDVMLVDIGLPGISGIELTRQLKERYPGLEIVIYTVSEDSATILDAIRAGASGYVLKGSPQEEIIRALEEAYGGGSMLSGKIARKVLNEFRARDAVVNRAAGDFNLTGREEDILNKLVEGASYKEIADDLGISFHTVNNHTRRIYEKMRVNSRAQAMANVLQKRSSH